MTIFVQKHFRLLVTGGGTGGHTYPALTTVRALTARLGVSGITTEVVWAGNPDGLEATVAASEGIAFRPVATGKVRRASSPLGMLTARNAADMVQAANGVVQARSVVRDFRPDVVLSTGGYAAVPIGLAARQLRRPLVVHEQTVRLGLANRVLVRGATAIAISESSTMDLLPPHVRARTVVTGNPIRPELFCGDAARATVALDLSTFDPDKPVVYVTGGAQGAVQINRLVSACLPTLLEHANVIHQCGPNNTEAMAEQIVELPGHLAARYRVVGFVTDALPDVLALADLVVSRSGAGTLAELTALGKPAVLIPLASSAGNEQLHNAHRLRDLGAAVVLDGDITSMQLEAAITALLTNPDQRLAMASAARAHGRPDAAHHLVDVLLQAAGTGIPS
ncbi:UDP-N-acetylglucosamine--N-acetylmuramyl-(pentapeptide) pyrophosphoryl-undecaprenol N-acetylglucosamine transferase [Kribbella sp. NPDC005582]|uniref:UDP-N-acetylglucosamine--N-acetylmuramyl- (pentapeptide) pyrophosphoryl-undecaprenol N-acetylglucosamine transferase n=1 Tax=Kribbella sp. NPDC005582 TaxID=3156893 RepID=UPI0033B726DA